MNPFFFLACRILTLTISLDLKNDKSFLKGRSNNFLGINRWQSTPEKESGKNAFLCT